MPVQEPQSVSQEKIDKFAVSRFFVCILSSLSSVFVGSDIACLPVDDANGALQMVC